MHKLCIKQEGCLKIPARTASYLGFSVIIMVSIGLCLQPITRSARVSECFSIRSSWQPNCNSNGVGIRATCSAKICSFSVCSKPRTSLFRRFCCLNDHEKVAVGAEPDQQSTDDSQVEQLSSDGEELPLGNLNVEESSEQKETVAVFESEESQNPWQQMKSIMMFAGPALGLWLCNPFMSLISTSVIGHSSSLELAALGPGTVLCDYTSYVFMFLSIATSNIVATSLAQKDQEKLQNQISTLLLLALTCGLSMFLLTKVFGLNVIRAFVGSKNASTVPATNLYVQIRGLAWPAVLVGMVAQSASLGMKDALGPLKVLLVSNLVNGIGHLVLCVFLGYGIRGAACSTTFSQILASCMMVKSLLSKGYNPSVLYIPSMEEIREICQLAAPIFVTLMSKIAFYSLLTYSATSLGRDMVAAHQVMSGIYRLCNVFGEPLSQTAQTFLPSLIYGKNRNLAKARRLAWSLLIVGALSGIILGCIGSLVELFLPWVFTSDTAVIRQMHRLTVPFFLSLIVTPSTNGLEGSLVAGRDVNFQSVATMSSFFFSACLLLVLSRKGLGFQICWWTLVSFQWIRFSAAYLRLKLLNLIPA